MILFVDMDWILCHWIVQWNDVDLQQNIWVWSHLVIRAGKTLSYHLKKLKRSDQFKNIKLKSEFEIKYEFRLTFINDDHYFANVAIVQNVFNGACRIFWGIGYDKLGFKTCFLVIGSTVSLVTASLPALPYFGNKF